MRRRPDVSVVVACHDAAPTVGRTLASLRASIGVELEIVCVDDGSSDETLTLLRAEAARDERVVVVRHRDNRGLAAARNTAMARARGRWVGFVDADDQVTPDHLRAMVRGGDRADADLVRADHVRCHPDGRELRLVPERRRHETLDPRHAAAAVDHRTIADEPHACFGLVRDELVESGAYAFPEDLRAAEDRVPWWRLLLVSRALVVVSSSGYRYWRGSKASLSQGSGAYQLDLLLAQRRVVELVAASPHAGLLLPKAIRQTVGLLTVNGSRTERFGPGGRDAFNDGARDLLGDIERTHGAVWDEIVLGLPPSRAAYLESLREVVPA